MSVTITSLAAEEIKVLYPEVHKKDIRTRCQRLFSFLTKCMRV